VLMLTKPRAAGRKRNPALGIPDVLEAQR